MRREIAAALAAIGIAGSAEADVLDMQVDRIWEAHGYGHALVTVGNRNRDPVAGVSIECTATLRGQRVAIGDKIVGTLGSGMQRTVEVLIRLDDAAMDGASCSALYRASE